MGRIRPDCRCWEAYGCHREDDDNRTGACNWYSPRTVPLFGLKGKRKATPGANLPIHVSQWDDGKSR